MKTENTKMTILIAAVVKRMLEDSKPLPQEFSDIVHREFWNILEGKQRHRWK